jgi:hypothetical protein
MIEVKSKYGYASIFEPDDVFVGTSDHPRCCFFELFPSSPDPEEVYYGEMFCHMRNSEECATICKGDYCRCPLAGGLI